MKLGKQNWRKNQIKLNICTTEPKKKRRIPQQPAGKALPFGKKKKKVSWFGKNGFRNPDRSSVVLNVKMMARKKTYKMIKHGRDLKKITDS